MIGGTELSCVGDCVQFRIKIRDLRDRPIRFYRTKDSFKEVFCKQEKCKHQRNSRHGTGDCIINFVWPDGTVDYLHKDARCNQIFSVPKQIFSSLYELQVSLPRTRDEEVFCAHENYDTKEWHLLKCVEISNRSLLLNKLWIIRPLRSRAADLKVLHDRLKKEISEDVFG